MTVTSTAGLKIRRRVMAANQPAVPPPMMAILLGADKSSIFFSDTKLNRNRHFDRIGWKLDKFCYKNRAMIAPKCAKIVPNGATTAMSSFSSATCKAAFEHWDFPG
jgi:hypothetical protein